MRREELKNPEAIHRCDSLERARKVAEAKAYLTGVGVNLYVLRDGVQGRFIVALAHPWTIRRADSLLIIGTVRLIDGVAEWH